MATGDRPGSDHLTHFQRLEADPQAHHIFHALRVIEAHFKDAPPLGRSRRPREDRVRLSQEAELAFPPTTIRSFESRGDAPAELVNRFFGYFGPHGPLPAHLTEYARERALHYQDRTLLAFLNTFTHRFMSLLYRAWTTGQPAPDFDRGPGGRIDSAVAALAGLGSSGFRNRDAMPDLARLHFAGFLAPGPRHSDALVAMVSAFFHVPVSLQEFVGTWLPLERGDQWQLGAPARLGQETSIGTAVWSRTSKFRLRLGPLTHEQFQRLLPGGPALDRLVSIVRTYAGDALDWDVNLVLAARHVPPPTLGEGAQLGLSTWIGTRDATRDADDLFLAPQHSKRAEAPAINEGRTAA